MKGNELNDWLAGGGQMAAEIRALDWTATSVGPIDEWPPGLKTAARLVLNSRFPMFVWWGPQLINIYNDAYAPILGKRHPDALGRPAREVWHEIWDTLDPQVEAVFQHGQATWNEERLLILERNGYPEETYFTWSYSPFPGEDGTVAALFCACTEDTARVLNQRRLKTLRELLASISSEAISADKVCRAAASALAENAYDLPFTLIYLRDQDEQKARLAASTGLQHGSAARPNWIDLRQSASWPLANIAESGAAQVVTDIAHRFGPLTGGAWQEPATTAIVLPLRQSGELRPIGYFIAGLNPCRPLDDEYRGFLELVAGHLSTAIATIQVRGAAASREAELRAEAVDLIESVTDGFASLDREWRFTYVNAEAERLLGMSRDEILGRSQWELFPETIGTPNETGYRKAAAERVPVEFENYYAPWERWFDVKVYPAADGGISVFFRDVTDRKRAEQARDELNVQLQERLSEFQTLLDVIPLGIGVAQDRFCRQIRVNPAFAKVLGIEPHQNASKSGPDGERPTCFRCVDDSGLEIPAEQLPMQIAAREGREVRDFELTIVHEDGRSIRLLEYAAPLFDATGEPRGCVGAFVDVTERHKAEDRRQFLMQLDDAVRPLTDPSTITATTARLLGDFLQADRCAYAEVEPDEDTFNLLGDYNRGVSSIVGRYAFTDFGAEVLRLMRANVPYVVHDIDRHQPPPESLEAYRLTQIQAVVCAPLHKAGKFVAAMAVHQKTPREWTSDEIELVKQVASRCWESIERARVTRELQQSEATFRQLANSIPQLAWMANPDGWIFWYNERWYSYTGTTLEQMQGWGWQDVHDPAELPRVVDSWKAALAAGEPWEAVFPLRRHDGQFRWHLSRALPLKEADGRISFWFGTNTDVTEQRRLSEERRQLLESEQAARAEAERIGRMKDEFLATLSHELRTPLNAILGYATLMRMTQMSAEEAAKSIETIERNAKLQAKLIEDLLDMNRIISGKIRLDIQTLNLSDVIEDAVTSIRPSADAKSVLLQTFIDPLAGPVRGDPGRLQQIVWNLLSNSVKFTPRGGKIQVALERVNSHVEITVTDTGQGISPEFLPYVFDRFRQADASTTRQHGGLGLGLSIVRQLVELHGGTVRAVSEGEGQGATFVVAIPLAIVHGLDEPALERQHPAGLSREATEPEQVSLAGVRVLVVDDEPDATALVKHVLEECQAEVAKASSAQEAWDLLAQRRFDVLVSDIGMPVEDGYQLIRRLRTADGEHREIPAVALTAFARSDDRRRAALAGFQTHLSKPVEVAELIAVVANLAGRTR